MKTWQTDIVREGSVSKGKQPLLSVKVLK